jgi:hypothetical protein
LTSTGPEAHGGTRVSKHHHHKACEAGLNGEVGIGLQVLKRFEAQGLIALGYRRVSLTDAAKLRVVAGQSVSSDGASGD